MFAIVVVKLWTHLMFMEAMAIFPRAKSSGADCKASDRMLTEFSI